MRCRHVNHREKPSTRIPRPAARSDLRDRARLAGSGCQCLICGKAKLAPHARNPIVVRHVPRSLKLCSPSC